MIRKPIQYSDTWDEFIRKAKRRQRTARADFHAEATMGDQLSLLRGALRSIGTLPAAIKTRHLQDRIAHRNRFTLGSMSSALPANVAALMPAPKLHPVTPEQCAEHRRLRRNFYLRITYVSARTRARLQRDTTAYFQRYRLVHASGGPVSADELTALLSGFAALRQAARPRPASAIQPAGLTPERALEIATRSRAGR